MVPALAASASNSSDTNHSNRCHPEARRPRDLLLLLRSNFRVPLALAVVALRVRPMIPALAASASSSSRTNLRAPAPFANSRLTSPRAAQWT